MFLLVRVLGFVVYSEHPISVGFWVVFYFLVVSIWVGYEWSSYIAYLLFFVYVGALLVMFCMVVRLAPNPVFRVVPLISLFPFVGGVVLLKGRRVGVLRGMGRVDLSGSLFLGLGVFDGLGWGVVLVWLRLILLLVMVAVVGVCKWLGGPLVRFTLKNEQCECFFS